MTAAEVLKPPAAPAGPAWPGSSGVRLVWLHLRSRRIPAGILALAACGGVLNAALHWHWAFNSGPYAQQVPLIIEAGAATVIAVTTHSPFGETERSPGCWLPYLRLFAAAGMCGLAIALLQLGAAGDWAYQGTGQGIPWYDAPAEILASSLTQPQGGGNERNRGPHKRRIP